MIRRVRVGDGGRVRALRLEMLADTPLAFITTLAEAAAMPHSESIGRTTRGASGRQVGHFVAEDGKLLVGQVIAVESTSDPGVTMLFAIYVSPAYRGTAVLPGLIDAAAAWSVECGRTILELEVVTRNKRAARAYRKLGFQSIGSPVAHPTISTLTEQIMSRSC
ncbi:MAG TPA: GNAT family N-acetyltransferase [Micromonosporaceae bacterium]